MNCIICEKNTNFVCVCDDSFCSECAVKEDHDGTTEYCWKCKQNICKSYMSTFKESNKRRVTNVCYNCGMDLMLSIRTSAHN